MTSKRRSRGSVNWARVAQVPDRCDHVVVTVSILCCDGCLGSQRGGVSLVSASVVDAHHGEMCAQDGGGLQSAGVASVS